MRTHMRVFARVAVYLCVAFVGGCGGGSPVAPSANIPNINGQWTGAYTVIACTETSPVGACSGIARGGPHSLTPSQNAGSFTGQLGVGVFSVPVSGSVDAAGVVTLAGSGPVSFATLTINTWRAVMTGSSMTGTMTYTVVADGVIVTVNASTALSR